MYVSLVVEYNYYLLSDPITMDNYNELRKRKSNYLTILLFL